MSRIILTGSPRRLYKIKRNDLPRDLDITHSFFEYVDFSGFDLSDYDLRDSTIYNCLADGVTLGEGKTEGMESRFTSWTGANLPTDLSSFNHDLVVENYRQAIAQNTDESRIIAKALELVDDGTYLWSWNNTYYRMVNDLGLTKRQVLDLVKRIHSSRPRLITRLQRHFDRDEINNLPALSEQDLTEVHVPYSDQVLDISGDLLRTRDRWEQSRHLEALYPEVRFYVAINVPFPLVITLGRKCDVKDDEWWWSEIWNG